MHDWSDRLRAATDEIIASLTHLQATNSAQHGSSSGNDALCRLTASIAQITQLQEVATKSLTRQLRHQTQRLENTERRLAILERVSQGHVSVSQRGEARIFANDVAGEDSGNVEGGALIKSQAVTNGTTSQRRLGDPRRTVGKKATREETSPSKVAKRRRNLQPEQPQQVDQSPQSNPAFCNEANNSPNSPAKNPRKQTPQPRAKPQPIQQRELPKLPTIEDVENDLLKQRQAQHREKKKAPPPPCTRCRVRKRADMMRAHGRIKEDVYERWSKRPGGCLPFMHMDEPGAPPSPLSFDETETASPTGQRRQR